MSSIYQNGFYFATMTRLPKQSDLITGAQLRGARGLLNMSASELAERTGLALNTIRRAEAADALVPVTTANRLLLVATLEEAGIVFLPADDLGEGVRLRGVAVSKFQRRRN